MDANGTVSPEQAQQHLRAAEEAERATRFPPVPRWLIAVDSVLLPLLVLAQLASSNQPMTTVAIAIVVVNFVAVFRVGVLQGASSPTSRGSLALALVLVVVVLGSFVVHSLTGTTWIVVVAAVASGVVVTTAGLLYRRAARRWA